MGPALSTWTQWLTAAGLLLMLGILLYGAWWSLFSDRPRGKRRCPRCWYDLTYSPGMRCGECGYTGRSERAFYRTRRRPAMALVSIFGCVGIGLFVAYRVQEDGWLRYVPTRVVIWSLPWDQRSEVTMELDRRIRGGAFENKHWSMLLDRAAGGDRDARAPTVNWVNRYGGLASRSAWHLYRNGPESMRTDAGERALAIAMQGVPNMAMGVRPEWPAGVGVTVDVVVTDWWTNFTELRITTTPKLDGAESDIHVKWDAPIQQRSFSLLLPPLAPGEHDVAFDVAFERRVGADGTWTPAGEADLTVAFTVVPEDALEPVSGADLDAIMRNVIGGGLVKYDSGSLPVRVGVQQQATYGPLFDGTAVGARIDVLRNGVLARQLDIWWRGGTDALQNERQNAWEVPMLDDAVLGAPANPEDVWEVHVRSMRELAYRVRGVSKYWEGEVRVTVPVVHQNREAPSRGWVPESLADGEGRREH